MSKLKNDKRDIVCTTDSTLSYTTALDYNTPAKTTKSLFAKVQNKLHWVIHRHTAAELITECAPVELLHRGRTSWELRSLERIIFVYRDPDSISNIIVPITNIINDNYCYQTSKKIRQLFDYKRRNGQYIGSFQTGYPHSPAKVGGSHI